MTTLALIAAAYFDALYPNEPLAGFLLGLSIVAALWWDTTLFTRLNK